MKKILFIIVLIASLAALPAYTYKIGHDRGYADGVRDTQAAQRAMADAQKRSSAAAISIFPLSDITNGK